MSNEDQRIEDFNRGVVEGIKHQSPSPDTLSELKDIKDSLNEFKKRALNILIAGIIVVGGYGIWVGTIQSGISQLNNNALEYQARSDRTEQRMTALEVNNGEIKAKLVNIETTLQEIKMAIKNIK